MRVEAANLLGSGRGIEVPWKHSADDGEEYFDLRTDASLLARIGAAKEYLPLGTFLAELHGEQSVFSSVRAKTWIDQPGGNENGGGWEFHSRCDLILHYEQLRYTTAHAEDVMRRLVDLWMREPSAESLRVRIELLPCKFVAEGREGGALRIEVAARGENAEQARMRWGLGLARVQQALLFVSRAIRQKAGIEIES
jgi:hypothetical protein